MALPSNAHPDTRNLGPMYLSCSTPPVGCVDESTGSPGFRYFFQIVRQYRSISYKISNPCVLFLGSSYFSRITIFSLGILALACFKAMSPTPSPFLFFQHLLSNLYAFFLLSIFFLAWHDFLMIFMIVYYVLKLQVVFEIVM